MSPGESHIKAQIPDEVQQNAKVTVLELKDTSTRSIEKEFSCLPFFNSVKNKVAFEMFAKEFSRKREGILIMLQSHFKSIAFQERFQ